MIVVISVLNVPRYCVVTNQLVYRRATQTTETNAVKPPVIGHPRDQKKVVA